MRYRRNVGSVTNLNYHLVFCPKYRRPVLVGAVAERLTALLLERAQALDIEVLSLEVMPDHVHLFVSAPPTEAVQHFVNQFKGYSSRVLREEFPDLRTRLPALWSRSYYAGSAGHVSSETIQLYIANQRRS